MESSVLDKSQCKVIECKFKDIRHIFEGFHYKKGHMGGGISTCFALYINDELSGGAVLGLPRHSGKYPNAIDIRRMACLDNAPQNSESYFIGQIKRWVKENTSFQSILSYSDMTVGHKGTIYKASGFELVGETSPTKYVLWKGVTYHPRSLSIDRAYSYQMREDIKTGQAELKTGLPKKIWMLSVVRKTYKRTGEMSSHKQSFSFQPALI